MQTYPEQRPRKKRRLKLFLLLLVVAAIPALVLSLAQNQNGQVSKMAAPQKTPSGSQEDKVLVYDADKYMFGMPENWEQIGQDELKSLNASGGIKRNDGKALATMSIVSKTIDGDELLGDIEKRQKQLPDYEKISDGEVKVGDHKGVEFVYTYTNNDAPTQQAIYAVSTGGETYYLAFTAAKDDFGQYKDEWAKILAVYRIK